MSFESGKIDSKIAPRNDAARKHHMATKSLHVSRTPSLIDSCQSVTVKDTDVQGLTYKYSKDEDQQAFIEDRFFTVEQQRETQEIGKLQHEFISPRETKHAWVPSSSPSVYEKAKPKLGNQLEKKVPNPDKTFNASVDGLLIVNGRRDMGPHKGNGETHTPRKSPRPSPRTSMPYRRVDDARDDELEDTLVVGVPTTPPPAYSAYYDGEEAFYQSDSLRREVEEEQMELERAAIEIDQRRKKNEQKLEQLNSTFTEAAPRHSRRGSTEEKVKEIMFKKVSCFLLCSDKYVSIASYMCIFFEILKYFPLLFLKNAGAV